MTLFNPDGKNIKNRERTALLVAISSGALNVAKALVAAGADIKYVDALGSSALNHCAASNEPMQKWVKSFGVKYKTPVGGNSSSFPKSSALSPVVAKI